MKLVQIRFLAGQANIKFGTGWHRCVSSDQTDSGWFAFARALFQFHGTNAVAIGHDLRPSKRYSRIRSSSVRQILITGVVPI